MSISGTAKRVAAVGLTALALGAGTVTAASAAPVSVYDPCGYIDWGKYRHCDGGTGSTVMLDVEDFFRNIYHYCVGPGTTDLQPVIRWRVINAWWNGGVGCQPGFDGPA